MTASTIIQSKADNEIQKQLGQKPKVITYSIKILQVLKTYQVSKVPNSPAKTDNMVTRLFVEAVTEKPRPYRKY